jgi:predicted lipoprotein
MSVSPRVELWQRRRVLPWIAAGALMLVLFPPFHIRVLGVAPATAPGTIDVSRFAQRFWAEKLAKPAVTPIDPRAVIGLLNDPQAVAMTALGHRTGIGGKPYFFIAGQGRVVAIDSSGVWMSGDSSDRRQLLLPKGPIFGDALRDATGLLRLDDFTSSDFNALSAELDRCAEAVVQTLWHSSLQPGAQINFVAAAAIDDASAAAPFLRLAPVRAEVQP